ncbi:RNA-binding protein NOB1 [Teleopsis dalmanni]|uniref:RNA-binding protein NOB1 n=1 Tax=Teleopsis dalmanni TaxID=139649 RepID=UPI0018CFEDD3|nr:RNA-binding protein NOB1 [Teleopsis dalmanni]
MTESTNKIKYLVADTTAFINAVQLNEYAENVLTVPDVVAEVRNKRQIRRLCVLPFDLQVREPRTESVKYCVEFAKKTGDYASLSGIDIKVIALTYELEADNVGTEHLRQEPVLSKTVASKDKPEEFQDNTKLVGWYNPKHGGNEDESDEGDVDESDDSDNNDNNSSSNVDTLKEEIEKQIIDSDNTNANNSESTKTINISTLATNADDNEQDEVTQKELETLFERLKCEPTETEQMCDLLVPEKSDVEEVICVDEEKAEEEVTPESDDLVDDGWITPANIKKAKKLLEGKVEDDIIPLVACMSTDFALQNVLKQMNLHISALNGRVIKHLRTYILRCYACFKTTSIMTKVFCPNCGNKTLKRVAVSLDENGKQVIHINTRRPLTSKYKNQSLPRFQGGKHSRNPILFEDQPIPRQMPSRVAKTKTNALEEDYTAGFSPFVMRDVDSKSAILRSKGHLKEWARNNTYEEDRRKKYYNRLYK